MKKSIMKIIVTLIAMIMVFAVTGCGDNTGGAIDQKPEPPVTGEKSSIVVYFSCSGNTQTIANFIKDEMDAELFRIVTVNLYPEELNELYQVGQRELDENARPELAEDIDAETFEKYDTVFIGYPIWGGTMPMAVYTFLESHEFNGKTVIPFCTHGGSGLGRTESTIGGICKNATIKKGLSVYGTRAGSSRSAVTEWLKQIGVKN